MIFGVGTDVLEIERVQKLLAQPAGDRFMQRVLTPEELELAARRKGRLAEFVAGRFAAKEAAVKALGCGIGKQVGFRDIAVLPDEQGKPHCRISDAALERLGLSDRRLAVHLSISHSVAVAMAYCVIEERP
ncbi:holo-ACP synthase [Paenibacillus hamazuiensis]|uniref:holo-ACP synthase n=1 Tax=Paenibacillus hamazuiensis TaxID=2936508 RepID=UPI002010529A